MKLTQAVPPLPGAFVVAMGAQLASVGTAHAQQPTPPPPPAMAPAPAANAPPPPGAPNTAAPQMLPPPPPPPGPVPTAAPTMPPGPAPAAGPVPTAAPEMVPAPPPPAVPPPPPAPSGPTWGSSFGVRVGARLQDPDKPKNMTEIHLDNAYDTTAEARFHGAVNDYFSWVANFNANVDGATLAAPGSVGIMDLVAQFKAANEFQIWAGRLLVPSDRSNFAGPFFMAPWNYPGFYVGGQPPLGPKDGQTGRDQGVTVWGNALDDKLKYYAGAYGLDEGALSVSTVPKGGNPYFSGRLSYSIQGSEPGYFGSSTYYGAKNVITIGISGQYEKDGIVTPTGSKDRGTFMADALVEENVERTGTFTFEGQFYKFTDDDPFGSAALAPPGSPVLPKEAFYVMAAYLTPEPIGIGKIQPLVRLQQTADPAWTIFDASLAYVVKDYSGRVVLTYQHMEGAAPFPTANSMQLGVQLQTL